MPAKGSVLLYGNRDYIFNPSFYKKNLVEKKKVDLTYKECKEILEYSNKAISDIIRDELDGFKLPFGFGYISAARYIPKKDAINWEQTKILGKKVFHTNMHTDGYAVRVQWFRVGRINNAHFNEVFKFKAYKTLRKKVSDVFKRGKGYVDWTIPDFIEKGRLENLYNKRFRKEFKE